MDKQLEFARELQALAQTGLYYCKDKFCRARYERIREIAAEMLTARTDLPLAKVKDLFCGEVGYQTPKVDTRAAIFKDGKILLVQEEGGWALPGGWCEVNLSPAENVIKEAREEAGLECVVEKVIAVQDRAKHNRPLYIFNVVKIFYLCRATGGEFTPNIETTARKYFAEDELPAFVEYKCTAEQVKLCFKAAREKFWETYFD